MTTKLKNLQLTSVDLVREGANQKADICIFKSSKENQAEPLGEDEKEKRKASWLSRLWTKGNGKEKEDRENFLKDGAYGYLDTITASMASIIQDSRLTENEKITLAGKSLCQYHEQMLAALGGYGCNYDKREIEEILEV